MDITRWPINKILQIPDSAFGIKWPIVLQAQPTFGPAAFELSVTTLSERIIIWEISAWSGGSFGEAVSIGLALANVVPTTEAQWNGLNNVLQCCQFAGDTNQDFVLAGWGSIVMPHLKLPVETAGQKLCARFQIHAGNPAVAGIGVVVSSVPKEVPDCLISA